MAFHARHIFDPREEGLKTFNPEEVPLWVLGTYCFRSLLPAVGAVGVVATASAKVDAAAKAKVHRRLRVTLAYATRALVGLGARLERTGIVEQPYEAEANARQRVTFLSQSDVVTFGPDVGEWEGEPQPSNAMMIAAVELDAFGSQLAALPREKDVPIAQVVEVAADYSWLLAGGTRFAFTKAQQRAVIGLLHKEWIRAGREDGAGLTEQSILSSKEVDAGTSSRITKIFDKHPALGTVLLRGSKGSWALYLNKPHAKSASADRK